MKIKFVAAALSFCSTILSMEIERKINLDINKYLVASERPASLKLMAALKMADGGQNLNTDQAPEQFYNTKNLNYKTINQSFYYIE